MPMAQSPTPRHGSLSLREAKPIPPLEPSKSEARWRAHGPIPPPTPPALPHPTSRLERHRHPSATSSRTRGSQRKRPVSAPPTQAHGASKRHPSSHGCRNIFPLRRLQTPPPFHAIDRAPRRVWGTCAQQLRPPEFREPMALEACGIEKQGGFPFRPWRRNRALLKVWPPRLSDATPRLVHFGPRPYLRAEISNAPGPTRPGPQAEE